jgi:hypothetical protein
MSVQRTDNLAEKISRRGQASWRGVAPETQTHAGTHKFGTSVRLSTNHAVPSELETASQNRTVRHCIVLCRPTTGWEG